MKLRRSHWVIYICLTLLSAGASSLAASKIDQPKASPRDTPAPQAKDSDYVGAEVCKTCHEEIYNGWEKTPHWKTTLDTKGGPSHQGCEGCHGPGAAHVAGGGDKSKIFIFAGHSTKEIDDRCMTCHASSIEHKNAVNSMHHQNDVSCVSCHSPHHAQTAEFLLSKPQPALCYTCHLQQKAQFAMPFHHRVDEGLVQCTDCHNPHGTELAKQVRLSSTSRAARPAM
jgi:DmsE family decaheme c-type cytochrome